MRLSRFKSIVLIPILLIFSLQLYAELKPVYEHTYEIADSLLLLPTPRQITIESDPIPLKNWVIAVMGEHDELTQVGAAKINRKINDLKLASLPVHEGGLTKRGGVIIIGSWYDPEILAVAEALDVRLAANDPGPQGYVIDSGTYEKKDVILLAGSDPQGTLYACITFKQLLRKTDGQLFAVNVGVRDWPDFKRRNNGRITLQVLNASKNKVQIQAALDSIKSQIDFYLDHKINYLYVTGWTGLINSSDEKYRAAIEALHYARHVGIQTRFTGGVEISDYISEEERALTIERKPGTAYGWTRFDAHRAKAQWYGKFFADAQASKFVLHPMDSGGFLDPEKWSQRSAVDSMRYGNDRTQAEIELFRIYFDIVRSYCPEIELEAVSLPYHFQWVLSEFPEKYQLLSPGMPHSGWMGGIEDSQHAVQIQDRLKSHYRRLAQEFDNDIAFTFREASRSIFEGLAVLVGEHPIDIWIYPDRNKGWEGSFCPQVRMAKTFWFPERDDYYYVAKDWNEFTDGRVQRLAQQEYLWNTEHPDATIDFTIFSRFYQNEGIHLTQYQKEHLIPRITSILYGESAEFLEPLIRLNISMNYVAHPVDVADFGHASESLAEPYIYMKDQSEKFASIHEDFQRAINQNVIQSTDYRNAAWILHYYKYTGICALKSQLEAACNPVATSSNEDAREYAEAMLDSISVYEKKLDEIHSNYDTWYKNLTLTDTYTFLPPAGLNAVPEYYQTLEEFEPGKYTDKLRAVISSRYSE